MIDYKKHRERLAERTKGRLLDITDSDHAYFKGSIVRIFCEGHNHIYPISLTERDIFISLWNDAEELLDKAETHDKAVERIDELGMALTQIHASIATSTPLPDGMSILEFIAQVVNSKDSAQADKVIN